MGSPEQRPHSEHRKDALIRIRELEAINSGLVRDFNAILVSSSKTEADLRSTQEQLEALRGAAQHVIDMYDEDNVFTAYSIDALEAALNPATESVVRSGADLSGPCGKPPADSVPATEPDACA